MATTEADNKQAADDFAAGYEDEKTSTEMGDDEAFGLTPEEAPGTDEPSGTPSATIAVEPAQDAAAAPAAPAASIEETAAASVEEKVEPVPAPEDDAAEPAAIAEEEGGDDEASDMKALADDFGPEFVALITSIIKKVAKKCATDAASEHTAPYRQDIDAVIAELNNEKQRAHYEKIADAHPDFMDIADSAGFKSWMDGMEPAQKAQTEQVAKAGNAKEIIAMLKQYKATLPAAGQAEASDDDMASAMDNAEGVRSSGLKLPDAPASQDDYAAAWNQH